MYRLTVRCSWVGCRLRKRPLQKLPPLSKQQRRLLRKGKRAASKVKQMPQRPLIVLGRLRLRVKTPSMQRRLHPTRLLSRPRTLKAMLLRLRKMGYRHLDLTSQPTKMRTKGSCCVHGLHIERRKQRLLDELFLPLPAAIWCLQAFSVQAQKWRCRSGCAVARTPIAQRDRHFVAAGC